MKEVIRSKDNQRIKDIRKLHKRKYRLETGYFLIEGQHLLDEALRFNQNIIQIILVEDIEREYPGNKVMYVSDEVMKTISQLVTPPGIMAVVSYQPNKSVSNRVLLLDNIQDPKNMGTLIRSADAFGFRKVYVSKDSVDVFSDKVIRGTQGSLFHVDIEITDLKDVIESFQGQMYTTALENSKTLESVENVKENIGVILGNEGSGVGDDIMTLVPDKLSIQMTGHAESLNVAIAGSIIMHHLKQ